MPTSDTVVEYRNSGCEAADFGMRLPQFEGGGADAHRNTSGQDGGAADALLVDHGAIGGVQVFNGPLPGARVTVDTGMVGRHEFVIEHHGVRVEAYCS